ncbi:AzlC family ABC transporter permease [Oceanisphaera sp. KMM 10153]|uniref:AzlC family ABC transporter permease n=1 Tax=Oceanisphaera submarina TaxID=3390193 RepID=UPI0039764B83
MNQINPTISRTKTQDNLAIMYQASIAIFPLCAAVIPWGVLCGSLAIQASLTPLQAQAMSLFVFAGAAQLAGISLIGAASSPLPILSSTFVISSRHLLYSAVYHDHIRDLPLLKRVTFAFFLTDEMFAITNSYIEKNRSFNYLYAVTSGVVFYVMWNISTLIGIIAGSSTDNLEELGLEFAIAATFIAIVIPSIKHRSTLVSVVTSGVSILVLNSEGFGYSLIAATLLGMVAGFYVDQGEKSEH